MQLALSQSPVHLHIPPDVLVQKLQQHILLQEDCTMQTLMLHCI